MFQIMTLFWMEWLFLIELKRLIFCLSFSRGGRKMSWGRSRIKGEMGCHCAIFPSIPLTPPAVPCPVYFHHICTGFIVEEAIQKSTRKPVVMWCYQGSQPPLWPPSSRYMPFMPRFRRQLAKFPVGIHRTTQMRTSW